MKRKHQSCRGNEHRSNLGVREVDGGGGGNVNPLWLQYVLWEMKKTNIWPAAVGYRPLNGCAAGKEHRTLAISAVSHPAKCDDLCLTPHPSLFYISCAWLRDRVRVGFLLVRACLSCSTRACVCVCFILLIEVWGLCCSQSSSHILKHQIDTTAHRLH